ncbi:MAG: bifunctional folylpolyglutamate synthase/dihydrofolate synthase [Eubacteriaceae bacterium]|nr:bifunctional folylpolyglutamate synthase/dihydrofolate synthase [Eubacteriaceae bacterium]
MNAVEKIGEFLKFGSVLGLERMNVLLEKLGNPQDSLKVIHVAGTNGKGSICRYIYEVLQAGGYKTGLYTSPYIEVFNERIEFDHEYISDSDLEIYTDRVIEKAREMVDEGHDSPTEFEITTAIGFLYFAEKKADYVVLEVGLGGTGDSTNVVSKPVASVIASISLDHTDRLGNTIAEIAAEKSGIIKEGCPVITSAADPEALDVITRTAIMKHAPIYYSKDGKFEVLEENLHGCIFMAVPPVNDACTCSGCSGCKTDDSGSAGGVCGAGTAGYVLQIGMLGRHQIENAMAALTTLVVARENGDIDISDDAIIRGFAEAKHIGRFEIMQEKPYVIIDGAHNADGSRALRDAVEKFFPGKKVQMVVGMLADKDVERALTNFRAVAEDFIVTEPDNPRKMSAEKLAGIIRGTGTENVTVASGVKEAVNMAKERFADYDLTLFAGSLYLIGEIRGMLK